MPITRSRKLQRTEQHLPLRLVDKFSKIAEDPFRSIFKCLLNDGQGLGSLAQASKRTQVLLKNAMAASYRDVNSLTYPQLKIYYLASKFWFPEKNIKKPVDVILLMPNLQRMDLSGIFEERYAKAKYQAISGIFNYQLQAATKIRSISLGEANIHHSQFVQRFKGAPPRLQEFDITFQDAVNAAFFKKLAKHAPGLAMVKIPFGCVEEEVFEDFLSVNPDLFCIDLSRYVASDQDIGHVTRNCKGLYSLEARNQFLLSSESLNYLGSNSPNLRVLDLSKSRKSEFALIANSVTHLVEHCKELKVLKLAHQKISDDGLKAIATHAENLETLDLSGCRSITAEGVLAVIKGCKKLKQLFVKGCPKEISQNQEIKSFLKAHNAKI